MPVDSTDRKGAWLARSGLPGWVALLAVMSATLPATSASAQSVPAVSGRVIDDRTGRPIAGAVVRILGTDLEALTDGNGSFAIRGLPTGERHLALEHLAYGAHIRVLLVEPASDFAFEIRLSPEAIELAPLIVEAPTELEARRLSTGFSMSEVVREEIDQAVRIGQTLPELLRDRLPGALVRGPCILTRGARGGDCEVAIILDDIAVSDPASVLALMPISDIERLELISPGEASARYGNLGANGVLLIETLRGTRARRNPRDARRLSGLDWSLEPEPYRWRRVLAGTFLANAAGLGVSLALSEKCFRLTREASLALRTECNGFETMSAGFLSIALPSVAGALAARWAGGTTRSRGRVMPAAVTGGLGLLAGYMLVIQGDSKTHAAGVVTLSVAVPVLAALSDRAFRSLR